MTQLRFKPRSCSSSISMLLTTMCVVKLVSLVTLGGTLNLFNFKNLNIKLPYDSVISLLYSLSQENWKHMYENLYTNVQSTIIHNNKTVGTIQTFISFEWVNKMWSTLEYTGILFSHKKEWSTKKCSNLDEPWKPYAKCKKPYTEGHIVYDSIYMNCLE